MLPPGNRRRAFHWEKYRRSAGDSCIANEPPENAQLVSVALRMSDVSGRCVNIYMNAFSCKVEFSCKIAAR